MRSFYSRSTFIKVDALAQVDKYKKIFQAKAKSNLSAQCAARIRRKNFIATYTGFSKDLNNLSY